MIDSLLSLKSNKIVNVYYFKQYTCNLISLYYVIAFKTVLTQGPFTALRVCNDSDYIHVSVFGILARNIIGRNGTKGRQN